MVEKYESGIQNWFYQLLILKTLNWKVELWYCCIHIVHLSIKNTNLDRTSLLVLNYGTVVATSISPYNRQDYNKSWAAGTSWSHWSVITRYTCCLSITGRESSCNCSVQRHQALKFHPTHGFWGRIELGKRVCSEFFRTCGSSLWSSRLHPWHPPHLWWTGQQKKHPKCIDRYDLYRAIYIYYLRVSFGKRLPYLFCSYLWKSNWFIATSVGKQLLPGVCPIHRWFSHGNPRSVLIHRLRVIAHSLTHILDKSNWIKCHIFPIWLTHITNCQCYQVIPSLTISNSQSPNSCPTTAAIQQIPRKPSCVTSVLGDATTKPITWKPMRACRRRYSLASSWRMSCVTTKLYTIASFICMHIDR